MALPIFDSRASWRLYHFVHLFILFIHSRNGQGSVVSYQILDWVRRLERCFPLGLQHSSRQIGTGCRGSLLEGSRWKLEGVHWVGLEWCQCIYSGATSVG
jgi:hypothetical protein